MVSRFSVNECFFDQNMKATGEKESINILQVGNMNSSLSIECYLEKIPATGNLTITLLGSNDKGGDFVEVDKKVVDLTKVDKNIVYSYTPSSTDPAYYKAKINNDAALDFRVILGVVACL